MELHTVDKVSKINFFVKRSPKIDYCVKVFGLQV